MELEIFYQTINLLTGAIRNFLYYPPGHPAIRKQIQTILNLISPLLEKGEVSIGAVDDVVVVNGEPLFKESPAGEEIKSRLKERKMSAFSMRKGVKEEELLSLVRIFCEDPAQLESQGGVGAQFQQAKIENIFPIEIEAVEDKARRVYDSARNLVVKIMRESRLGVIPQAGEAVKTIGEMAEIMISDRNAILGLTMLSSYDNYTFHHSVNVGILSLGLAQFMGHPKELQLEVGVAGLLHDIGKTFTPLEILKKPGSLLEEEWIVIRRHPEDGARLIGEMEGYPEGAPTIVFEHHMGHALLGYPQSEPGRKLHPGTGIVTISDCYDSMTTLRTYQRRFEPREALEKMNGLSGKQFDPKTLKSFVQMLGIYPIGSLVRLDDGQIALVTGVDAGQPSRPRIKIVYDREGNKLSQAEELDLKDDPDEREIVSTVEFMTKDLDISC